KGLAGKTGDEIEVDVIDARGTEPNEVMEHDGAGVKATAVAGFLIDERLDAETYAVDSDTEKCSQCLVRELAGSAFYGDFSIGHDRELRSYSCEKLLDEFRFEQARGASAEVYGIDPLGQMYAQVFAPSSRLAHLGDE